MTEDKKPKKIIIEGVTEEGKTFRPSDWAERVSGQLSTFKNHRIYYSPMLRPSYSKGNRCVVLDPALKDTNPELYKHILDFAIANKLKICGEEDGDEQEDNENNQKA
ncbi:MAG: DUF3579 domain-containing protein [Candidatus Berkiella sp.]